MNFGVDAYLKRAVWAAFAVGSVGLGVSPIAAAQSDTSSGGDVTQLKGVEVTGSRI